MQNFNFSSKIIIVDDDILICESLKDYLFEIGFSKIKMKHNIQDFFTLLDEWAPDFVLVDIRLENNEDGILIGHELLSRDISFIYITAQNDVNIMRKIIMSKPSAFVSKPIRMNELLVSIGIVMNELELKVNDLITFKSNGEFISVRKQDIEYIKSAGNYIEIYAENERIITRNTLDQVLIELDDLNFDFIHRSIIVNKERIYKIQINELVTDKGTVLPLSRTFSKKIKTNQA